MESIVTSLLKATFGFLVNTCRDELAERLKDGDVTLQNFSALIMRDKIRIERLAKTGLHASIDFFEEGIQLLYEVFEKVRSGSENGTVTTEEDCTKAFAFAEIIRKLDLTDLDKSATEKLTEAKKRFETARVDATRAFNNECLKMSDLILAMQYRVMATILEKVDNPKEALGTCRRCIEKLHCLPAIQECFKVELGQGFKAKLDKGERRKIISGVCHVNFLVYGVTIMVCTCFDNEKLSKWPCIGSGEDKVNPLHNKRLTEVLREQGGMEHFYVTPWSFGQEGEEEHKLKSPGAIATNSSGQFIVGDSESRVHSWDRNVKVFDSSGTFKNSLSFPNDDADTYLSVLDLATDMNDNIYILVKLKKPGAKRDEDAVCKFNNTADLLDKFPVWRAGYNDRLTVTDSGKVLLLRASENWVNVYETDGRLVSLLGKGILKGAYDITAANGDRVMVVENVGEGWTDFRVDIFSEHGDHLNKFKLQGSYSSYASPQLQIAFHRLSEHVVVVSLEEYLLRVEIYTKDGEFVRTTQIHEKWITDSEGMAVTTEGRIAVVCSYGYDYNLALTPSKILVI